MKRVKWGVLVALLWAATSGSALAQGGRSHAAHHGRARVGVFVNAPLFWPYYPGPYYYPYSPSFIVMPSAPPVYIEREQAGTQQYWYFCSEPQGYYPYVSQCPAGWQQVLPQPGGN